MPGERSVPSAAPPGLAPPVTVTSVLGAGTGTKWLWWSSAGGAVLVLCHCLLQEEVGACPGKWPRVPRGDCGLRSPQAVLSPSSILPGSAPAPRSAPLCLESINRYIWKSIPFVSRFLCDLPMHF